MVRGIYRIDRADRVDLPGALQAEAILDRASSKHNDLSVSEVPTISGSPGGSADDYGAAVDGHPSRKSRMEFGRTGFGSDDPECRVSAGESDDYSILHAESVALLADVSVNSFHGEVCRTFVFPQLVHRT